MLRQVSRYSVLRLHVRLLICCKKKYSYIYIAQLVNYLECSDNSEHSTNPRRENSHNLSLQDWEMAKIVANTWSVQI